MTDIEKLREAQDFINRELQKNGVGHIDAMSWGSGQPDSDAGVYRLALFRNGEESDIPFSRHALLGGHGSKRWERRLRRRVEKILWDFPHA